MGPKRLEEKPNLRRKRATRQERRRILVVTEGEVTEPQYFKGLARYLRETGVQVYGMDFVGEGRDPVGIVQRACEKSDRESSFGNRDGFDAVWCVFDVDSHARLGSAINLIKKRGFSVAVSNPCFEIWLLWHYEACQAPVTAEELKRRVKKYGIAKKLPPGFAYHSVREAIDRGKHGDGDVPENPGTGAWRLASFLCAGRT